MDGMGGTEQQHGWRLEGFLGGCFERIAAMISLYSLSTLACRVVIDVEVGRKVR